MSHPIQRKETPRRCALRKSEFQEIRAKNKAVIRESRQSRPVADTESIDQLLQSAWEDSANHIAEYRKRLGKEQDPYTRRVLQEGLRRQEDNLRTLLRLAEVADEPKPGLFGQVSREMRGLWGDLDRRSFIYGLVAGTMLTNMLGKPVEPGSPGEKSGSGAFSAGLAHLFSVLNEQVHVTLSGMREGMEDLVAEAQFERQKSRPEKEQNGVDSPAPIG